MVDADLSGADAQVFAKETGDEALLRDFREGRDIHSDNATFMFGERFTTSPKGSHERYEMRQRCKHSVHATHNVGSPQALVRHPSIHFTLDEARRFQRNWFHLHPNILGHFKTIERRLQADRSVSNKFGYRIIYFDRIENLLPLAIPWVNQSTVAEICFRGALQLESQCPWVEMLLQVHDSLVFQVPESYWYTERIAEIRQALIVPVPYDPPLVIKWKITASHLSWGDCKEI